jgi:hypothetical protein
VTVAIKVANANSSVDRRANVMPNPRLARIIRNFVPSQVILVSHRDDFWSTITVEVSGD